jgi:hypothetical protein
MGGPLAARHVLEVEALGGGARSGWRLSCGDPGSRAAGPAGGLDLVGLGVGLIASQVYAVAGHAGGGRMLAVVVTFGYGAFLVGPAIIGTLVGRVGISRAMALPLVLSVVLVALSRVLSRTETGAGAAPTGLAPP